MIYDLPLDPDWNDPPERGAWAIPVLKAAAAEIDKRNSRRKIDGLLVLSVTVYLSFVALVIFGTYPFLWHALVQFLTQPVVVDNAIGAAITIAGLAAIRYLRTRPREK